MYEDVIYFLLYCLGCLIVLIFSIACRVKGSLWIIIYIVLGTAMLFLRPILSPALKSTVDSVLFLVLLLWIIFINKHNTNRRKEK